MIDEYQIVEAAPTAQTPSCSSPPRSRPLSSSALHRQPTPSNSTCWSRCTLLTNSPACSRHLVRRVPTPSASTTGTQELRSLARNLACPGRTNSCKRNPRDGERDLYARRPCSFAFSRLPRISDRRKPYAPARSWKSARRTAVRGHGCAMSLWIKICGNTSLADALLAADAGADAVDLFLRPVRAASLRSRLRLSCHTCLRSLRKSRLRRCRFEEIESTVVTSALPACSSTSTPHGPGLALAPTLRFPVPHSARPSL